MRKAEILQIHYILKRGINIMGKIKGFVSYIMIIAMLLTLIPFRALNVKAATNSNLSVQSYRYNSNTSKYELTVTWQGNKSTKTADLEYHVENSVTGEVYGTPKVSVTQVGAIDLTTSRFLATFDVSDLKENFLYDIKISTYDDSNVVKMSGYVYFITGIGFDSERVDNTQKGVFESGTSPELKLSWKVPRVWTPSGWLLTTDPLAIKQMNDILKLDIPILNVDFKINISTKAQKLDSGADVSPIFIKNADPTTGLTFKASNASGTAKDVVTDSNDYMSLNIVGRKDSSEIPVFDASDKRLYHSQIQPGTVYFMNIKPTFTNTNNEKVDVFTLGDPTQYNGSLVRDKASGLGYTYTPVRFKITRDAADNIYVTAYRINKDDGSLDMPNLYYSIQAIDTPITTYGIDWPEKARMTDQFFPTGSKYAVTVITGVDVNTPMYYKVVVKTDSKADRLESLKILYTMSADTSKPPIPINVKVDMTQSTLESGNVQDPETGDDILDQDGNKVSARTTDILLTWDKPSNYESLSLADKQDLVYHVMISTNVEDLKMKYPLKFAGLEREFLINYRWVKAISATDTNILVDGDKLTYRLKGFNLFENIDNSINYGKINNPDKYPEWLIENTIYYVKMFTTKTLDATDFANIDDLPVLTGNGVIDDTDFSEYVKGKLKIPEDVISQTSVVTSFTTLPGVNKQVPVPMGFKATGEDVNLSTKKNYINLQFDSSSINWDSFTSTGGNKEVYELFMASGSTDNPEYVQIGSSDSLLTDYTAELTMINGVWTVLVPDLKQNTVYRFKLRLKLDFGDVAISDLYSDYTAVVSVTTRKVEILPPDATTRIPRAPIDFNIGKSSEGKDDLSGTGVGLGWSILEDDVTYELVVTATRIDANASEGDFKNDAYYQSFMSKFSTGAGAYDNVRNLNPTTAGGKFNADLIAKLCKYRVEAFMVPNNIYFYSLRAQRIVILTDASGNEIVKLLSSEWVTVPVTTSMIETPLELEAVTDYQLGVSWTDETVGIKDTDYTIYIKKSSDTTYKPLDITRVTIIQDGSNLYARIRGLESSTSYDIGAFKGTDTSTLEFTQKWTLLTRDEYHNVEVRWKGIAGYNYEIAMRDESTGEYVIIAETDFEQPIIKEKAQELLDTNYYYYYARILKKPVTLSSGVVESIGLSSNTKYYIKVRATQTGLQPSNYAGPVTARTSFKQSDYDNTEDLNNVTAKLVDKINSIEQKPYYSLNYVLSTTNTVLLKGDRLAEELKASPYHEVTIDLTSVSSAGRRDEVYIPQYLAQTLKDSGGSIDFVLDKAEYTLVSSVLDESTYNEVTDLKEDYNEEEVWFKLVVSRPDGGTEGLDATVALVSPVNIVQLSVLAVTTKYSDLKTNFINKIYNSETGLVKQQKDQLEDLYTKNPDSLFSQGDYLIDVLVNQVEKELADYVKSTVEGGQDNTSLKTIPTIILSSSDIKEFSAPMVAKLFVNQTTDFCQPYGIYVDGSTWNKLSALDKTKDIVSFEFVKAGKYFVGVSGNFTNSVSKNHWAYDSIVSFNNKYNIADVFSASGDFNPDSPVSIKDSILVLDKVFSKESVKGESLQKKVSRLGLSSYFTSISPLRDLSREQAATIYVISYSTLNGLSSDSLNPSGVVIFNDAMNISSLHLNNAKNAVALGFISCDASNLFNPSGYVTRAEFITSLQKALQQ